MLTNQPEQTKEQEAKLADPHGDETNPEWPLEPAWGGLQLAPEESDVNMVPTEMSEQWDQHDDSNTNVC